MYLCTWLLERVDLYLRREKRVTFLRFRRSKIWQNFKKSKMVLKQQNAKKGRKYAVFEATSGAEKACGYAHGIQEVESSILFVSTIAIHVQSEFSKRST